MHDVAGTRRALAMAAAIATAPPGAYAPDAGSWPWAAGATAPEAIAQAQAALIDAPKGQRW